MYMHAIKIKYIIIIIAFKMLATRLAIISGKLKSVVLSDLYSRLNLHLLRTNATAILSRWLPS